MNNKSDFCDNIQWEYFVTPLVLHTEAQILNNWGSKGWELVQISPGPNGGNVAFMKRRKVLVND